MAALQAENERLRVLLADKDAQIADLKARNAELEERVARLERLISRNSNNSSMPPSTDDLPGKKPPERKARRGGGRKCATIVAAAAMTSSARWEPALVSELACLHRLWIWRCPVNANTVIAVCAVVIAGASLIVSVYEARATRKHNRYSVR